MNRLSIGYGDSRNSTNKQELTQEGKAVAWTTAVNRQPRRHLTH
jgi:hypothetical protein